MLVDNAGRNTQVPDGVLAASDDDWLANLDTNLLSVVRVDRVLVPHMVAQGRGAVVHVSSNAARYPQPNGVPYAAAKAALNSYSKSLALACGPHGVRVTAVMPGVVETDAVEASLRQAAERTGRDLEEIRTEFHQRLAAPLGRPEQARGGGGTHRLPRLTPRVLPHRHHRPGRRRNPAHALNGRPRTSSASSDAGPPKHP